MVNPDAVRGQVLLEESREAVVVLDENGVVVAASRRARQSLGVREGDELSRRAAAGRARARRPVQRRRTPGTARLPLRDRRPRRLRGAALRASPRRSRTSCGRRSPACSRCSSSRSLPGENVPELARAVAARDRPDRRADRRGALPGGARVGHAGRLPRRRAGAARAARRSRPSSRSRRRAPVWRCASRATRTRRRRCGPGCCASSRRTSPRTRSATPGPARTRRSPCERERRGVVICASSTTAPASTRPTCRVCSSASTAPTARAPRAAPGSGWRS